MTGQPRAPVPSGGSRPVSVLLAAGSARWEAEAVARLSDPSTGVHLLHRCLDLTDLLGAASTGSAEVAVLADRVSGLDADTVGRLHRNGVRVVAVTEARAAAERGRLGPDALRRLEVDLVLTADDLVALPARVREVARAASSADVPSRHNGSERNGLDGIDGFEEVDGLEQPETVGRQRRGRLVAVWGAGGAPGRTSTAIGVAAEAAARGHPTLLVDADPYGGAVAQQLAVLDEASGLLGAARLANAGQLDLGRLASLARALGPGLRVLTGLPRPGRWTEVRPSAFEEVLAVARRLDDLVVVDTGPGIDAAPDDPFDATPNRDGTTRAVLQDADAVVVVASPDPVGLQRVARAVTDLVELRPSGADLVVVNRMRATLGWDQRDVLGLLQRVAPLARVVFLPDDSRAADRALVSGRTLVETGDSSLRRAVAALTTDVLTVLDLPDPSAGTVGRQASRGARSRRGRRFRRVADRGAPPDVGRAEPGPAGP